MRAVRLFTMVAVAAILAAGGCGPSRHAASDGAASAPPAVQRRAPAPADPDLGTVTERFYQYVQGGHWVFAYAMLSPRYRESVTQTDLMHRYEQFADADVALRHVPGTTVTARIDGTDRRDRSRRVRIDEALKFVWDGEQWRIDDIARRDAPVTPSR